MSEENKNTKLGMLDIEMFSGIKEIISESKMPVGDKLYDEDGNFMYVWNYDNVPLPVLPFIRESMPLLPNFQVRDDDVFLCAFPSSGTHWFWEMICMLINREAEHLTGTKEQDMMEFLTPDAFEKRPSPRVLNTHLRPKHLPKKMVEEGKIILLVRNPKDVVVSNYRQTFGLKLLGYDGTFPSFFNLFLEGNVHYGSWYDHMNDWMEAKKNNPNILLVTYEEAKKDCPAFLTKLSNYLNLEPDEDLIKKIAEFCSFKKMKTAKESAEIGRMDMWKKGSSFFRSGKAGTWKDWLTVRQNERMEESLVSKLKSPESIEIFKTS